ncbi:hypothetical protein [Streptomyces sp. NPDC060187]|uniref:hypothetical protein n=1 Tax=Streptomyces sp. NPDC060187 TaxID=3347067 RepID=UPI003665DC7C
MNSKKVVGFMHTRQALVAIGGRASRLRVDGVEVAVSKSFLPLLGRPFLHWNLSALYVAGVRRVVLAAESQIQLREAEMTLSKLSCEISFDHVEMFQDSGLGVHGLPHQARDYLDDEFIFECGHSLIRPVHYQRLSALKEPGSMVVSGFNPHRENPRQPVRLARDRVHRSRWWRPGKQAIAHPFVVDREYIEDLPALGFNIRNVVDLYAKSGRMKYVFSDMPPEFDLVQEMKESSTLYREYLSTSVDFWRLFEEC